MPIRFAGRRVSGMTLVELISVMGVIGVLAAIAISQFSDVVPVSERQTVGDRVALMNRAVLHFNETNWELALAAAPDSADDELAILRTLQWRSATSPAPGSPYLSLNFPSTTSTSSNDYRVMWNGKMFELLLPGTAGAGIKVDFSNPTSADYTFPEGYKPVGAP